MRHKLTRHNDVLLVYKYLITFVCKVCHKIKKTLQPREILFSQPSVQFGMGPGYTWVLRGSPVRVPVLHILIGGKNIRRRWRKEEGGARNSPIQGLRQGAKLGIPGACSTGKI